MNDGHCQFWSNENPHWVKNAIRQGSWGINVWCDILGNSVIGLYFNDGNLTGRRYLAFLKFRPLSRLQNVPNEIKHNIWSMHDGAPSYNLRTNVLPENIECKRVQNVPIYPKRYIPSTLGRIMLAFPLQPRALMRPTHWTKR